MSFCYFIAMDAKTLLQLDCVENLTWGRQGEAAQYTVISGKHKSDHYHPSLRTISFNGMISQTKVGNVTIQPEKYMTEVNKLIDNQQPFEFFIGSNYPQLEDVQNIVITEIQAVRDVETENGLLVSISLKEIDFNDLVSKTTINAPAPKPSKGTNGSAAGKGKGGTGSKGEVDKESGLKYTQMAKAAGYGKVE